MSAVHYDRELYAHNPAITFHQTIVYNPLGMGSSVERCTACGEQAALLRLWPWKHCRAIPLPPMLCISHLEHRLGSRDGGHSLFPGSVVIHWGYVYVYGTRELAITLGAPTSTQSLHLLRLQSMAILLHGGLR